MEERRRSRRLPLPLACAVERGARGKAEKALIGNISFSGALLRLGSDAAPGASLSLSFTLGAEHLERVPASVVWCRKAPPGFDCGVSFPEDWSPRLRNALLNPGKQSVLIVEDDAEVRAALERHLSEAGYLVDSTGSLKEGWRKFEERPFDLVVADLGLPDGDGMEFLGKVRAHPKRFSTPVVILTADARQESKLAGLAFGADQYLVKPVDPVEFLFAASALLRRAEYRAKAGGIIRFERGEIDPAAHVVRLGDSEISNLSRKEFDLLYHLIASRPRILSKRYILSKLWHTVLTDNTVEVHIKHLRDKLGPQGPFRIITVSGKGYKFI